MEQKLTLLELTQWIKNALNDAFPGNIWLVAEISDMKENRSGHCYLELVEKKETEIIARARATIWSYTYRMLKPYFETTTGQLFSQGIKILVQVSVEFHPAYGLSLNIKDIDPAFTVGDLAVQRKEIVKRLQSEGIFDMNRELALPMVPQKIAVISSRTAAGYQDFVNQLETNQLGIKFYTHLFEASMQGADAVPSIIEALELIFQYEEFFDAVAIIRGGGAAADLNSFDNYELAFNVTQFPLPVITGIGHEKDDTIIDMVSHTRLKTPTAVAEFFIDGAKKFYERLTKLEEIMISLVRETVDINNGQLDSYAEKIHRFVVNFITEKNIQLVKKGNNLQQEANRYAFNKQHELSNLKYNLRAAVSVWNVETKNTIDNQNRKLKQVVHENFLTGMDVFNHLRERVKNKSYQFLAKERERFHLNENAVRLLNPDNVLNRGYTLTLKDGKVIKSVSLLELNDEIETCFSDGKIKSKITKKV